MDIVFNEKWVQGKGLGVVAGVQKMLTSHQEIQQLIIAVCDQPFVTAALLVALYQKQKDSGKHIVASAYADTLGTPVLFTRQYFDELLALKNEEGAKQLLTAYREEVATVDFPQGYIDIDTQEEYAQFLSMLV